MSMSLLTFLNRIFPFQNDPYTNSTIGPTYSSAFPRRHSLPYILGSTTSLVVVYTIHNDGETAFLPELNVTVPAHVRFTKLPAACRAVRLSLICDLSGAGSQPLANGQHTTVSIHLDTTQLRRSPSTSTAGGNDASTLRVLATVSSSGDESNVDDNRQWLDVELREFSTVEVIGWASTKAVSLEEVGLSGAVNLTHTMELRNGGPSAMDTAVVEVAVPRRYVDPFMLFEVDVFDWQSSELVVSVLFVCVLCYSINILYNIGIMFFFFDLE